MPNDRQQQDPLVIVTQPVGLYFTRLPDDERHITKTIVGTLARGTHAIIVRGAWEPDAWDALKAHRCWNVPRPLSVTVEDLAEGVRLSIAVVLPLKLLPVALWPRREGDEWKAPEEPRRDEMGVLSLGTLVRTARARHHDELTAEAMCMLSRALTGKHEREFVPPRDDA